ncbi:MAG: adenylyltransferase/cytidyltransferase family protein [bacterium]|nr:adenylyltransferase/cytidyltransferase family protein [bacterium]
MASGKLKKAVLVFGTFDGLHEGHVFFLREAQKLGSKLIVSVAQDSSVVSLKNKVPRSPLPERMLAVEKRFPEAEIVSGDTSLGSWSAIKKFKPDVVALGYDQLKLKSALINSGPRPLPEIVVIKKHSNKINPARPYPRGKRTGY